MKRVLLMTGASLVVLAACTAPATVPGASPTPTPIPQQEILPMLDYLAYTSPIAQDLLTTVGLALETVSIESSERIIESFEAAATNLGNLLQYQDDIEALRLRFSSMPATQRARRFEGLIQESFSDSTEGLGIMIGAYVKFAEDRGFPTREDIESFAQARGQAEILLATAVNGLGEALDELTSISDEIQIELDRVAPPTPDPSLRSG